MWDVLLWDLLNSSISMIVMGAIISWVLSRVINAYQIHGKQEVIFVGVPIVVFVIMTSILGGLGALLTTLVVCRIGWRMMEELKK